MPRHTNFGGKREGGRDGSRQMEYQREFRGVGKIQDGHVVALAQTHLVHVSDL
jgi:hypothetical protein